MPPYRNQHQVELYSSVVRRAAFVFLILISALPVSSQDRGGIYGQIGSVGGLSLLGRYVSVEPALGWRTGVFSAALVPRLIAGTTQFDAHVAPQLLLQVGRVYLQAGYVFELVDNTSRYQVVDTGPTAALGVRTVLAQISGGALVLDTGFEVFLALEPDQGVPPVANIVPDNALDELLDVAVAISAAYSLLRLGLVYTLGP